jgi:hypothetical protein
VLAGRRVLRASGAERNGEREDDGRHREPFHGKALVLAEVRDLHASAL